MQRFTIPSWTLGAACAFVVTQSACGDDPSAPDTSADTTPGDTTPGDQTPGDATPDTAGETTAPTCGDPLPALNANSSVAPNIPAGAEASQLTGVSRVGVSCTPPTPDPTCNGPVSAPTNAFEYPYCGLNAGGDAYTCNGCPDGHPALQGRWRAIGTCPGAADLDVDYPAAPEFAELLFVEGNTWYSRIDNGATKYEARGWYFCAEKPEHPNAHLFWVTTEVLSDTEGVAEVGGVHETDVPLTTAAPLLLFYFDDVGAPDSVGAEYCKIGELVGTEPCYDPYTRRP